MKLAGTPGPELLAKITSEEVKYTELGTMFCIYVDEFTIIDTECLLSNIELYSSEDISDLLSLYYFDAVNIERHCPNLIVMSRINVAWLCVLRKMAP